jgi:hypothetical protein
MVFTVEIPKDKTPRFPSACVACNAESPGTTLRLYTHAIGWWTALFAFGPLHHVDVPTCKRCKRRLLASRALRFLFMCACLVAAMGLTARFTEGMEWRKLYVLGAALLAVLPWLAVNFFFPAAVDVTAYDKKVEFDFRDDEYAQEFAEMNDANVS